jgi:hypothetical protein
MPFFYHTGFPDSFFCIFGRSKPIEILQSIPFKNQEYIIRVIPRDEYLITFFPAFLMRLAIFQDSCLENRLVHQDTLWGSRIIPKHPNNFVDERVSGLPSVAFGRLRSPSGRP